MRLEPKKELIGENVILKKPEVTFEFAQKMYAVIDANREHILPWLEWAMPSVTKSAEDDYNFAFSADKDWEAGKRFEYAIFDKNSGEYLGGTGVMQREKENDFQFEIGYWLAKSACGKGVMQEVVKLIEREFFSLGVERIVIKNDVRNLKSKQVAERLGYYFEGVLRHSSYNEYLKEYQDINVFSKLRSEYVKESQDG